MEIILNGIPISEEQCIGDSLPYINAAFIELKNSILESINLNNSLYLKASDFIGYYSNQGGIIYGGAQIGGPGINSAAVLRFGKTANGTDSELTEYLPSIFCSSSSGGNDLSINANSDNAKIFLKTGTPLSRKDGLIIHAAGSVCAPTGNFAIGSTVPGTEKFEVNGGNIKVTAPGSTTLALNNNIANQTSWKSKIEFQSNGTAKYELGIDPNSNQSAEFYLLDRNAGTSRFIIRNTGRVYIPGNVGIGTEPVADKSLILAGGLQIGGSLSVGTTLSVAGITSTGSISGTAISGTTGTFTGKVTTPNLESSGPVSGTTGTFSGKITTTSNLGIESYGPVVGTTFTGQTFSGTGYSGGPISGTTGTFTGKVTTPNLESSGPVSGTTGTFNGKVSVSSLESSGSLSATSARFTSTVDFTTLQGIICNVGSVSAAEGTIDGTINVGSIQSTGQVVGYGGNFLGTALDGNLAAYDGNFNNIVTATNGFTTNTKSTLASLATNQTGLTASGTALIQGASTINNTLTVTGVISCNSDIVVFATSDERLKNNITPITNALDKLSDIRGCEFEWNEALAEPHLKGKSAGLIAQEVEKVFPEAVATRENGYKAVRYEYIIPLLVEAIKDLQDEIEDLKNR